MPKRGGNASWVQVWDFVAEVAGKTSKNTVRSANSGHSITRCFSSAATETSVTFLQKQACSRDKNVVALGGVEHPARKGNKSARMRREEQGSEPAALKSNDPPRCQNRCTSGRPWVHGARA